ncbi:MAG: hypothetical protein FD181_2426 [Prolixibacteraceae bacterium]|nr:MAG: hypothetical protein FD181_2426 [Prolixibacteraceae bacterium]
MKNYFHSHPFAKIGILAVPMLFFMILMEILFQKLQNHEFQSFIIDFGFMVSYTLFLILFFQKAAKTFNKKWLLTGIPFALIVLPLFYCFWYETNKIEKLKKKILQL